MLIAYLSFRSFFVEYYKLLLGQPFPFDSYERLVEKYRSNVDYRIMRKYPTVFVLT